MKWSVTDIRTFYRIVWTDPPTLEDFQSHLDRRLADEQRSRDLLVSGTAGDARQNIQLPRAEGFVSRFPGVRDNTEGDSRG